MDEEISVSDIKGKILILTLRYKGAVWGKAGIVHLHLFNSIPQGDKWCVDEDEWDKNHIESHASYRIIKKYNTEEKKHTKKSDLQMSDKLKNK